MTINRRDAKILNLLQQDNRLTNEQIGEAVGLSSTAVVRRLKRLRDDGVIEADISIVSPKAAGYPISFIVACSVERDSVDTLDRFAQAIRADPEIISASKVTGEADFVLRIVARSMASYNALLRRYHDAFPGLKNVTSFAILEEIKRGFAIPVEADGPDSDTSL